MLAESKKEWHLSAAGYNFGRNVSKFILCLENCTLNTMSSFRMNWSTHREGAHIYIAFFVYHIALHDGVGVCVMQYYNEDHILSGAAYKTGSSKNYATTPSYNKSYKYIYTHIFERNLVGCWSPMVL